MPLLPGQPDDGGCCGNSRAGSRDRSILPVPRTSSSHPVCSWRAQDMGDQFWWHWAVPVSACSSLTFPGAWWARLVPPACVVHRVLSCTGLTGTGDNTQDLGHHLEGQVQSSHHSPLAQPYILRPSHLQERLLHQHQDFIHPVHRHSPSYACGRWHTATSHTGSPVSIAKPSHSPGRCQAEAPTHSRLSRAPIMGSSAR